MRVQRAIAIATLLIGGHAAWAAGGIIVDQIGQKFSLSALTAKRGDIVQFVNHDDTTHNINLIDADDIAADQGLQKPGETIRVVLDRNGRFTVRCAIHPRMKLAVTVQ